MEQVGLRDLAAILDNKGTQWIQYMIWHQIITTKPYRERLNSRARIHATLCAMFAIFLLRGYSRGKTVHRRVKSN
jgi:hypothetical protein